VLTTNQTKHDMVTEMQMCLNSYSMWINQDLVTTDDNPKELLEKLRTQLLRFSYYTHESDNPLHASRTTFSGKGSNNQLMDDLAMTALIGASCVKRFFSPRSNWARFHRTIEFANDGRRGGPVILR
jgi:hypothetical protein